MYRYACDRQQYLAADGTPFLKVPCLPPFAHMTGDERRTHAGGQYTAGRFSRCAQTSIGLNGLGNVELGGLSDAAAANEAAADGVTAAVLGAYTKAGIALGFRATQVITDWEFGTSNVAALLKKNFLDLGARIVTWQTTMRGWVARGHTDAGVAFDWVKWADLGRVYADQAATLASITWDSSPLNVSWQTITATAQQANPFNPTEWPTWLKVAAGLAALGGAAYLVNTAANAKRAFAPSAPQLMGFSRRSRRSRRQRARR